MLDFVSVSKRFSRHAPPALEDVSFAVTDGEIVGLLGHNGAGKSTALGILLGMVAPDRGEVSIGGYSVLRNRVGALRQVGAIFEAPAFYEYLSGRRNLEVLTAYSGGVSKSEFDEVVEWVGLKDRIQHRVGTYSHGMRQRLALAQSLLPRPRLLVLDEPTDGLDPEGIVEFRHQVRELRDQFGLTVLLSSHLLSEVEQVCDRVIILQKGKKIHEGPVGSAGERRLVLEIRSPQPDLTIPLIKAEGGEMLDDHNYYAFPPDTECSALLGRLVAAGARIEHYARREGSLEALYLRLSSISPE